ncbi:MAG: flagellar export protein FliJ [Bermanella sp.]|jgi:flagellar export protein FliJ
MRIRSESIKPVQHVAEQAEGTAAREYALRNDNHQLALAKREELKEYFAEYNARANATNGDAISPVQMRDNRAFLRRLSEIIRIQDNVVDQQAQQLEEAKGQWLSCRQQAKSLDQLSSQYKVEERKHADHLEQCASDEMSSVRHSWQRRQAAESL